MSATIIPFPPRPLPAPETRRIPLLTPAVQADRSRLTLALDSLNLALAEQRTALKAWRGAMAELKASTTALEGSLDRYRGNLRSLGTSVSALNQKARSLESWADKALDGSASANG